MSEGDHHSNIMYQDAAIKILTSKVESMREDFTEIRAVLKELTAAINKLALVEERQAHFAGAQERAFKVIAAIEERVTALEKRGPEDDRIKAWIDRAVLTVMGVVFLSIAKATGFL